MDFSLYDTTSIRGHKSVLDMICLWMRHLHNFLRRDKRLPLEIIQCHINVLSTQGKKTCRIRVDKDGAFANSSEFNNLLGLNSIQIETT